MTLATSQETGCSRCESPLEEGDLRCSVCALPVPVRAAAIDKAHTQILRCTECGAAVAFDANKQAPCCAFCGATMKIEQPIDPVEVAQLTIPFSVTRDQAALSLRGWLGSRGFFAPKTLRDEAVLDTLTPLCWAGWIVNATSKVAWTADSDAGSLQSSWAPHSGVVQETFGNIVIPASRGLAQDEAALLAPYYDMSGVVGIAAATEDVVVESFDAQRSAARQLVNRAIERLAAHRVEAVIPGRRFRNIHVSCLLERQTTDRIALPAWVLAYRYRGSPYRAIVHGQRPEIVFGTSPTDWGKVALVVTAILVGIAAIVALILALT